MSMGGLTALRQPRSFCERPNLRGGACNADEKEKLSEEKFR